MLKTRTATTASEKELIAKKYTKGKLLGKGGFAKCYEFRNHITGEVLAAKVIAKDTLTKPKTRQKLVTEIKIHRSLSHKYIVKFHSSFEDKQNVYILLELCRCKSLMDLMKKKKRLNESEARYFLYQILLAVQHMHFNKIIHRDLKLGNLFLSDKMEIKIGDFGLAAQLEFDGQRKQTICGTPNYIAPEILMNTSGHSYEVDVWSIGVIMYTLLIGTPPFETRDVNITYTRIKSGKYTFPSAIPISDKAKHLIQQILNNNPMERPTVNEILKHPFFMDESLVQCPQSLIDYAVNACGVTPVIEQTPSKPKTSGSLKYAITPPTCQNLKDMNTRGNSKDQDKENDVPLTRRGFSTNYISKHAPPPNAPSPKLSKAAAPEILAPRTEPISNHQVPTSSSSKAEHLVEEEEEGNLPQPVVWVKQWGDFSSRYGLAYSLNTGHIGAYFNDSSKLTWHPITGNIEYMERKQVETGAVDERLSCTIDDYPKDLEKKIILIKLFKSYLEKQSSETLPQSLDDSPSPLSPINQDNDNAPVHYVKRWLRTRHAVIFRLSDKSVQVRFHDNTEIILAREARIVTYTDANGVRKTLGLGSLPNKLQQDVTKRLKYTKDILYQLMKK